MEKYVAGDWTSAYVLYSYFYSFQVIIRALKIEEFGGK